MTTRIWEYNIDDGNDYDTEDKDEHISMISQMTTTSTTLKMATRSMMLKTAIRGVDNNEDNDEV